jgi:ubiquinone biosynthesis protein Coq4
MDDRAQLRQLTRYTDATTLVEAVAAARRGDAGGRLQITAAMAWVAFACPDATPAVCDTLAAAWLGSGEVTDIPRGLPQVPLDEHFWSAFWAVVDGHDAGYDALTITAAVASLGAAVDPGFEALAEAHARRHPGAAAALHSDIPGYTDMAALARCPADSLGHALYRLIEDNGYDPEVLERDAIGLTDLPHVLHYLNARILQMHEVWHLVAGYRTTGTGEIALSGFQLAQFGHSYSSMFLAAVMAISSLKEPRSFTVLMQVILEGWRHGRDTPAMMAIPWEDEWEASLEDIRRRYRIKTYASVFPPDLMETAAGGNLWRRAALTLSVLRYALRLRRLTASAA